MKEIGTIRHTYFTWSFVPTYSEPQPAMFWLIINYSQITNNDQTLRQVCNMKERTRADQTKPKHDHRVRRVFENITKQRTKKKELLK